MRRRDLMALDFARRGQLPLDAANAPAPARLPGDPVAGLERFRHDVLRRKLPPQFAGRQKVAGRMGTDTIAVDPARSPKRLDASIRRWFRSIWRSSVSHKPPHTTASAFRDRQLALMQMPVVVETWGHPGNALRGITTFGDNRVDSLSPRRNERVSIRQVATFFCDRRLALARGHP
jgi:hypothetical protein